MLEVWAYSLGSVAIVSIISLIGVVVFPLFGKNAKKSLVYMVSFSAGALFGDAFIHLLPEAVGETGFTTHLALYLVSGIVFSFIIEKFIRWRHCHIPTDDHHPHPFAFMNLVGDAVHNFIDGIIIGASYLAGIPVGIATTLAVVFHEIPQEIGDYGVLLHGGFTRKKAIMLNFLVALAAVAGAVVTLLLSSFVSGINSFIIPFAAGIFIYIAGSDLIPELHKEVELKESAIQLIWFLLGVGVMLLLLLFE